MSPAIPNSFGVQASAERLIEVRERSQLPALRRELADQPALLLGDGSNVLFASVKIELVVLNRLPGIEVLETSATGCLLQVAAGESWDGLVQWCAERGWWGIENLALIPGRVGAAPIQNIGAYGVEFAEVCESVEVVDRLGRWRWLSAAECAFGYRDSLFKHAGSELWISAVRLRLSGSPKPRLDYAGLVEELRGLARGERPGPLQVADAVRAIRRRKLPDPAHLGNAGSFFKNPLVDAKTWVRLQALLPDLPGWPADGQVKLSAAWLIEAAGWKGHRRGDAGVAPGHALVLVNHGRASGAELLALAQDVAADVEQRFGVSLETEPRII